MKHISAYLVLLFASLCVIAYADGDPEFVKLPEQYQENLAKYETINRAGREQVAVMYANDIAISSYKEGNTAKPGSVIIMEIYKAQRDDNDKAITNDDGDFQKGDFAAIAVMERQDDWPAEFEADNRLEGWGFAFYGPDGSVKANELPCVACHTPLQANDFLFSHQALKDYAEANLPGE